MAQTRLAARLLEARMGEKVEIIPITSKGDVSRVQPIHRMGAPGAFTRELQDAILRGEIDAAVHSLKDLPLEAPVEAPVVAILPRGSPRDVLVVRRDWHDPDAATPWPLKPGARVGTSAPRRQAQLREGSPEAIAVDIRGNVETRLRLVADGLVDALLMAEAPFERIDLPLPADLVKVPLPPEFFPGCPGQGAIAIQARAGSLAAYLFSQLNDDRTSVDVTLERLVLQNLGGGCGLPLGAYSRVEDGLTVLTATYEMEGRLLWTETRGLPMTSMGPAVVEALHRAAKEAPDPRPEGPKRLAGRSVLLAMDPDTALPYVEALVAEGARAAPWSPTIHEPLALTPDQVPPSVLDAWSRASWVLLASARAVHAVRLLNLARPNPEVRIGAVGPATARALRGHGFPVHLVSPDGTGGSLGKLLAEKWRPDGPVLAPGAEDPQPEMADALRAAGVEVVAWPVYRTRALAEPPAMPLAGPVDAVVVGAPSAARALAGRVDPAAVARRWIAFGPSTADAMRALGFPVDAVPDRRTPGGVLEVIP